ncbi:MAG: C25 family cysteine peptidase [Planctomycetota bacterium]
MTRIGLILLASFMATASVNAERPRFDSGRQWILVTTNEFQTAVSPLVRHRSSQGWKTEVIVIAATDLGATRAEGGPQTAGLLKERLSQHVADFSGSSCVLIVGHWTTAGTESPTGEHGRMRGAWTDHSLGFPDEDGAATVAVGRLPAKNVEQVKTYVAKILAYENTPTDQNLRDIGLHLFDVLRGQPADGNGRRAVFVGES